MIINTSYFLSKIFDPLFTTRQIGTGLGLPSCKNIVEKHGGTIDVKTKLGVGTTFVEKLQELRAVLESGDSERASELRDELRDLRSELGNIQSFRR